MSLLLLLRPHGVVDFLDLFPVTLTIREHGHTTTITEDVDYRVTLRERGHTITAREQQ